VTDADIIVVGAGIVGLSTAIELRQRGFDVVLVDRRAPGQETSFGNAGLVQREGVHPVLFPTALKDILSHAFKRESESNYHWSALAHLAPFLWRYWRFSSSRTRVAETVRANIGLFEHCVTRHREMADAAGCGHLIKPTGWLRVFRDRNVLSATRGKLNELRAIGLAVEEMDADGLSALEPFLNSDVIEGAVHYRDPWACSDPGALCAAYAQHFRELGGTITQCNVKSMTRNGGRWRISGGDARMEADHLVVAAGPWSGALLREAGLKLPMGIKRGYHCHYQTEGNAVLNRPVVDDDVGYVIAPMARGVRLTTGVEFAAHEALPTPVQLDRVEPKARNLFALAQRSDDVPWLGARPVFADMRPAMGEITGQPNLWINTGHGHQGFTLGPVAGRAVAQMIAGETTDFDMTPFSPSRFAS